MISSPPPPQPPSAPPNPPMFGGQVTAGAGARQRTLAKNMGGFGATILGQGNPANTGQKTLLGQ